MTQPATVGIICLDDSMDAALEALRAAGTATRRFADWSAFDREPEGAVQLLVFPREALADQAVPAFTRRLALGLKSVCLAEDDDALIGALRASAFLPCISVNPSRSKHSELASLVLALLSPNIESVASHLAPNATIEAETVPSYDEKEVFFQRLLAFAGAPPSFPDFPEIIVSIAWEMLMNAMIDAPAAAGGVAPGPVHLEYGHDGKRFALAISDPYGSLRRERIVESLERCHRRGEDQIREGSGGAGIGLYLLLRYSSRLHFVVRPGVSTHVVVVTQLTRRFAEFVTAGKVIHCAFEPLAGRR